MSAQENDVMTQCCDLYIQNEKIMRGNDRWSPTIELAALNHVSHQALASADRLQKCRDILSSRTSTASRLWDKYVRTILVSRMALSNDPLAYFEGVLDVYNRLVAKRILCTRHHAMAAILLFDNCPSESLANAASRTMRLYDLSRYDHPYLTEVHDLPLIALAALGGKSAKRINARIEECYKPAKRSFGPIVALTVGWALALSDQPVYEGLASLLALRAQFAASKHEDFPGVLAAYVDLDLPASQVDSEITAIERCLADNKSGGLFRHTTSLRLAFQPYGAHAAGRVRPDTIAEAVTWKRIVKYCDDLKTPVF